MKFLILTQYFPPEIGAAQVRLAALARTLVHLGHQVEIVTALPNYPTGQIFPEYRKTWFRCEEWEGMRLWRTWVYASRGGGLRRIINYGSFLASCPLGLARSRRPDCVFVESPPLVLGLPGLLAARTWRVPLIFNVSDLWPDSVKAMGIVQNRGFLAAAEALESFLYRNADYVTTVTEGLLARLIKEKGVAPKKTGFLPNGIDTELFKPMPADVALKRSLGLEGKHIVLYAGTHGYAHALEHALYAAREMRNAQKVHFLFLGDGSDKGRLVRLAQGMGLENVTFLDPVPAKVVPSFFSIACCGLVTLRNIPLFQGSRPAKAFAIMACGKPVLFAGSGEGARLVEEARAGLVVPQESPSAWSAAIERLVSDPVTAENFGRSGRQYVEQHLRWPVLVSDWLNRLQWRLNTTHALVGSSAAAPAVADD
jgi:colanic acid biosynthesis glycosyl transferase WcaI